MNRIKELKVECVKDILKELIHNKTSIRVTINGDLLSTYDDSSGQRGAYISYFSFHKNIINFTPDPVIGPEPYFVRRKLSFTNEGDEGKEDSVLLSLRPSELIKCEVIEINKSSIVLDNITIYHKG